MILGDARHHLPEFAGAPIVSLPRHGADSAADSADDWPEVEIDLGDPQGADTRSRPDGAIVVHHYVAVSE